MNTRSRTLAQERTILITGATSGIGRATAVHLARCGHRVFATGRRAEALDALREEAGKAYGLETLEMDVTDAASVRAAREEIRRRTVGESVDVLVNNAGYGLPGPLELIDDADLRAQFETNVFGLMQVTRAFLPEMREQGWGRIINVSSVGGRMALPFLGAYNASKFAVEGLSDALRMEVSSFGVDVVLIEPGMVRTAFSDRSYELAQQYQSPAYESVLRRAGELKARSDEIAVSPQVVVEAIDRAVHARRPRARYVVPRSAAAVVAVSRRIPTRMRDWAIGRSLGLSARRRAGDEPEAGAVPQEEGVLSTERTPVV